MENTVLEPTTVAVQAPAQAPVQAPAQAPVQAPAQAPAQAPVQAPVQAPAPTDRIDFLFNKMILNSSLLSTINGLKTNGFNNASIPHLILSIMATYNSYTAATPAHALTVDDIQVLLERVYNYFVEKYNLIDVEHRLAMYNLFDTSLQLCLAMPNVKKEVTSCLKFFKCGKK